MLHKMGHKCKSQQAVVQWAKEFRGLQTFLPVVSLTTPHQKEVMHCAAEAAAA